ncbi:CLUMA_CG021123, isoform A [Clunio marinus]|uniref:CLUMA_CG021123, isoform A n=1 Tax=Clunio marinus TaxID=568069 RepID=A0A1J1J6H5_9DIPT|nr:CLUMA_CG021123, isoform A [Clunio marinus]
MTFLQKPEYKARGSSSAKDGSNPRKIAGNSTAVICRALKEFIILSLKGFNGLHECLKAY